MSIEEKKDNENNENGLTIKPSANSSRIVPKGPGIQIGMKTGVTGANVKPNLRQRTAQAQEVRAERKEREIENREADAQRSQTMRNRLGLMMDISGSMSSPASPRAFDARHTPIDAQTTKIVYLQQAYSTFIESMDFESSALAVRTFPFYAQSEKDLDHEWDSSSGHFGNNIEGVSITLTTNPLTLAAALMSLIPSGTTPMDKAMKHMIGNVSLTRGIIISDGCADNPTSALEQANLYKEAEIPVDCVHIGHERHGEDLLKQIAEITGGIYIKFTDVQNFATALKYLTPRFRAMLTSGAVNALGMGASEVVLPTKGK